MRKSLVLAGAITGLAVSLTACGNSVTKGTVADGLSTHDGIVKAVRDGAVSNLWEMGSPRGSDDCIVKAIEDGSLSDKQLRVVVDQGNPDGVEDDAWESVRSGILHCKG